MSHVNVWQNQHSIAKQNKVKIKTKKKQKQKNVKTKKNGCGVNRMQLFEKCGILSLLMMRQISTTTNNETSRFFFFFNSVHKGPDDKTRMTQGRFIPITSKVKFTLQSVLLLVYGCYILIYLSDNK